MLDFVCVTVLEHLHEHARTVLDHQRLVELIQLHNELVDFLRLNPLEEFTRCAQIDEC
jgi:hypothetical protein